MNKHQCQQLKRELLSRFECQSSGNCCRSDGIVYASPNECANMAKHLNLDLPTFLKRYTKRKQGWTILADTHFRPHCFLDDNHNCRVYKSRPKACRSYPNWPEIWKNEDSIMAEINRCPGLQKAFDRFKKVRALRTVT